MNQAYCVFVATLTCVSHWQVATSFEAAPYIEAHRRIRLEPCVEAMVQNCGERLYVSNSEKGKASFKRRIISDFGGAQEVRFPPVKLTR